MEIVTKGEDIHNHCLGCIKIWKCTVRPQDGESCDIIPCDLDCGARFHACKREEHRLMCLNERVPCINAEYGCPSVMLRKYLGTHLNMCPASVIYCTMEWNRWPIPASKGQLSQQCHHQVFHKPQLDVALAMRDQRMLRKRWRQSNCAHVSLKDDPNAFTKCSILPSSLLKELTAWKSDGAVCGAEASLPSGHIAQSSKADSDKMPLERTESKVKQQRLFRGEPYRASQKVAETLNATLNMIANHSGDVYQGTASSDSLLFNMNSLGTSVLHNQEENKENIMDYVNHSAAVNSLSLSNYGIGCEKTNHQYTPMDMSPPVTAGCFSEHSDKNHIGNGDFTYEKVIELVCDCDVVFANDTVVSEISSASILDHARKDVNPPVVCPLALSQASSSLWYPSSVPPWCASLGLDLNVESITRYKAQPKSMYTFLCAQEFRRDEYAWHYKNVHSEIHGGLNGWLEERCPLAQYGCTFGRRRFYPAPKGSSVVHNEILESFGVKYPTPLVHTSDSDKIGSQRLPYCTTDRLHQNPLLSEMFCETNNNNGSSDVCGGKYSSINITQLPFEVLQYIAGFLDSFSLCNLSLTSRLLRDVCRSLLEERGIVVYRWERQETPKGVSWKVVSKRWFFSSSFSPIEQWCFEDGKNLSDHLKTCSYFNRNIKSDPYYYPMGLEPDHNVYLKLKHGIPETPRSGFENITTKL